MLQIYIYQDSNNYRAEENNVVIEYMYNHMDMTY